MRASSDLTDLIAELFIYYASSRWLFLLLGLKVHNLPNISIMSCQYVLVLQSHVGRRLAINTRIEIQTYIKTLLITRSLNLHNLLLRPLTVLLSASVPFPFSFSSF